MRYIVANWKSNINQSEIAAWLTEFSNLMDTASVKNKVLIAPPFPYLQEIKEYAQNKDWLFSCGQDVSLYEPGAHTGEVNAEELADFGKYCIVGHSERNEDTETVLKKVNACKAHNIIPIICFVDLEKLERLYIDQENILYAWEDPQNISKNGVYNVKDPKQIAEEMKELQNSYPKAKFLYGGSVNIDNVKNLVVIQQLAGVLVGHASLNPKQFSDIIIEFEKN